MYLITDLGIGKQKDKNTQRKDLSFPLSQAQFYPLTLNSSLPPLVITTGTYNPSLQRGNGEWSYHQHLAAPLCCSLLVMLLRSGAGPPQAAVNIAFPNHWLMQDSVLQTPWVESPRSGGPAPRAGCRAEQ